MAVDRDLQVKTTEMHQSVGLLQDGKPREALALVKTDVGLHQTVAITEALDALRSREREHISEDLDRLEKTIQMNTVINTSTMVFTIVVLLVLGLLVTRDIRRRNVLRHAAGHPDRYAHLRAARPQPAHEPRGRSREARAGARTAR